MIVVVRDRVAIDHHVRTGVHLDAIGVGELDHIVLDRGVVGVVRNVDALALLVLDDETIDGHVRATVEEEAKRPVPDQTLVAAGITAAHIDVKSRPSDVGETLGWQGTGCHRRRG